MPPPFFMRLSLALAVVSLCGASLAGAPGTKHPIWASPGNTITAGTAVMRSRQAPAGAEVNAAKNEIRLPQERATESSLREEIAGGGPRNSPGAPNKAQFALLGWEGRLPRGGEEPGIGGFTFSLENVPAINGSGRPEGDEAVPRQAPRLTVLGGPEERMFSFRIAGLTNPTLIIPHGAVVRLDFYNIDDDMLHDFAVGTAKAPKDGVSYFAKTLRLPPRRAGVVHGEELALHFDVPGKYYYLCTVKGHAQRGMWGRILVQ